MQENTFTYQWKDGEDTYTVEVSYQEETSLMELLEKFILVSLEDDGELL